MNSIQQEKQPTTATKKKVIRQIKGVVVSDKVDKTIVVEVATYKTHKKYLKKYRDSKKYKVHDPENKFKVGERVSFTECRPISKDKRWIVIDKK
ncbi:MAG TPA: 30S ribosomal protein S17 [Candidatus Moranbacteria bacterium]|nr:30S ribosomal protein S17 [Candidatus Moranbacteria bacterium]